MDSIIVSILGLIGNGLMLFLKLIVKNISIILMLAVYLMLENKSSKVV